MSSCSILAYQERTVTSLRAGCPMMKKNCSRLAGCSDRLCESSGEHHGQRPAAIRLVSGKTD